MDQSQCHGHEPINDFELLEAKTMDTSNIIWLSCSVNYSNLEMFML